MKKLTLLLFIFSTAAFLSCYGINEEMSNTEDGNGLVDVWNVSAYASYGENKGNVTLRWDEQAPKYFDHIEITYTLDGVKTVTVKKGIKTCLIQYLNDGIETTFTLARRGCYK